MQWHVFFQNVKTPPLMGSRITFPHYNTYRTLWEQLHVITSSWVVWHLISPNTFPPPVAFLTLSVDIFCHLNGSQRLRVEPLMWKLKVWPQEKLSMHTCIFTTFSLNPRMLLLSSFFSPLQLKGFYWVEGFPLFLPHQCLISHFHFLAFTPFEVLNYKAW